MNQYLSVMVLILSVLFSFDRTFCSSSEKPVSEDLLSILKRGGPLFPRPQSGFKIKDEETGMDMRRRMREEFEAYEAARMGGAIDSTPRLSAEQLKPLLRRVGHKLYAPVYNAADCALILRIARTDVKFYTYELPENHMRLIHIPCDMQSFEIKNVDGAIYKLYNRSHHSTYLGKDILPINEALMFIVNQGKIALSVGEKILVPETIEDTVSGGRETE